MRIASQGCLTAGSTGAREASFLTFFECRSRARSSQSLGGFLEARITQRVTEDPVMTKAYLDTCIVSGLAKEDLSHSEQVALLEILRLHKAATIQFVTSVLVKEEIDKIPEEHRGKHEVIYNLLANKAISRVSWTDGGLSLKGVGGGRRVDPLYSELKGLLPDEFDVEHVFRAIKSGADYFVTTDSRTILRYSEALQSKYGLRGITPSELANALAGK